MAGVRFDPLRVEEPLGLEARQDRVDGPFREDQIRAFLQAPQDLEPVDLLSPQACQDREFQPALFDLTFPVVRTFGLPPRIYVLQHTL